MQWEINTTHHNTYHSFRAGRIVDKLEAKVLLFYQLKMFEDLLQQDMRFVSLLWQKMLHDVKSGDHGLSNEY